MPERTIILIRHAQSEHHIKRLSGGWTDTGLTPLGHEQARIVAERLRSELSGVPVRLYSSDLLRAHETARHIAGALGVDITLDPALREGNNGVAANMTIDEVRTRWPNALRGGVDEIPYPEAETPRQFYARAGRCLDTLPDGGGVPLLVSHGGTIDKMIASWLRLDVGTARTVAFAMHTTAITVLLEDAHGDRIIERHNDIAHLANTEAAIPLATLVPTP